MIALRALRKRLGDFNLAVDLRVHRGEIVSILGPSGSGKTTLLRLIAGFETPDSGSLFLDGVEVTARGPAQRSIGFVFQDYTLFPHMDVHGNVAYAMRVQGRPRAEIDVRVDDLLQTVDLPGYGLRRVQDLSGGERQRVAIARALARDPAVLLLDEPFSSIDTPLRKGLRTEVMELRRRLGITVVFVTHSRDEALAISDRVAVLLDGKVAQCDTPRTLYTMPESRRVAEFVGEINVLRGVVEDEGGRLRVRCCSTMVEVSPSHGELRPGEEVVVLLRPHLLRFAASSEAGPLDVEITGRQYFGHYYEYRCRTSGCELIVFDRDRREIGDRCRVHFQPADAVVLPGRQRVGELP